MSESMSRRQRRPAARDLDLDGMRKPRDFTVATGASGMTSLPTMRICHWHAQSMPRAGATNSYQPNHRLAPGQRVTSRTGFGKDRKR